MLKAFLYFLNLYLHRGGIINISIQHLIAFLFSLGAVVLAEMGDKTELLAMAFATKYKAYKY